MGVIALYMRPYFIVNPVAGGGSSKEKFESVKRYLERKCVDFGYVMTDRADQSASLAEKAYEDGERYIIAVGGDGTINEVASALYKHNDVTMGICPFGTGNDFSGALGISSEPEKAAALLLEGAPAPVDMGLAGEVPFVNVGGMGFDVDVVINTEKYKGRFKGMLPYLIGIFKSMFPLNRVPVKLIADGREINERILLLSVANGPRFGGGIEVAPNASPTDGEFDVCIIKEVSLFTFLRLLPKYIKGRHLGKKPVIYFRAKEISIECGDAPIQVDGELRGRVPATFRILPGALNIMLPAKAD